MQNRKITGQDTARAKIWKSTQNVGETTKRSANAQDSYKKCLNCKEQHRNLIVAWAVKKQKEKERKKNKRTVPKMMQNSPRSKNTERRITLEINKHIKVGCMFYACTCNKHCRTGNYTKVFSEMFKNNGRMKDIPRQSASRKTIQGDKLSRWASCPRKLIHKTDNPNYDLRKQRKKK